MGILWSGEAVMHNRAVRRAAAYQIPLISNSRMPLERKRCRVLIKSVINISKYLRKKPNQNLLITGTTGQGKSKLMRLILEMMPNPKTIFSYKEGDEYLQIEGNLIPAEKSLPDPFSDPEAFTSAFAVTFNISSEGIQASTAMSVVAEIAKQSRTWQEFIRNATKYANKARDINVRAATNYLLQKIKTLTYESNDTELDLDKTNILDMSYLNDDAKTFYSELFLRQIYRRIRQRSADAPKIIVCVDEAHRLTKNITGRNESIINEMSREIRTFGMLWTATQNLSDIPDPLRNQFATQLAFSTTSEADLRALSQITRDLAICISGLKNHEFIDAKHERVHKVIDIYKADISSLKERKLELGSRFEARLKPSELKPKLDGRPSATVHAAMLAVYQNPKAKLDKLAKFVKTKGWITSPTTIYGNKTRDSVFETARKQGFIKKVENLFELTEKGSELIEAEKIIEKQADKLGSDLHINLIKRTIEELHKSNVLVTAPVGSDVPDLIAYSLEKKKRYLWDDKNRKAYEIQTTARKDSVLPNMERNRKLGLVTVWVTYDKEILEEIKKLTEGKDEYLLIKLD